MWTYFVNRIRYDFGVGTKVSDAWRIQLHYVLQDGKEIEQVFQDLFDSEEHILRLRLFYTFNQFSSENDPFPTELRSPRILRSEFIRRVRAISPRRRRGRRGRFNFRMPLRGRHPKTSPNSPKYPYMPGLDLTDLPKPSIGPVDFTQ